MYHNIDPHIKKAGRDSITSNEFEQDLKYLSNNGYHTITMTDLINYVLNDTPLPKKPIILTFDDGYYNNYVFALPLLKKYHMKAVVSIIRKATDAITEDPSTNLDYAYLSWK